MKKIEIEEITNKMVKKQTWLRKGLFDFLEGWKQVTKEEISGHSLMIIKEYENEGTPTRLILQRGVSEIDGQYYNEDIGKWETWSNSYRQRKSVSIDKIKEVIELISEKISQYFLDIQKNIDFFSEAGEKIRKITALMGE